MSVYWHISIGFPPVLGLNITTDWVSPIGIDRLKLDPNLIFFRFFIWFIIIYVCSHNVVHIIWSPHTVLISLSLTVRVYVRSVTAVSIYYPVWIILHGLYIIAILHLLKGPGLLTHIENCLVYFIQIFWLLLHFIIRLSIF